MSYRAHRDLGDENDFLGVSTLQPKGKSYKVTTHNTVYQLLFVGPESWDFTIQGFPKQANDPRRSVSWLDAAPIKCNVHGSTWGGSMLKVHFIGKGMRLEFGVTKPDGKPTTITTSPITDIEEI